MPSYLYGCDNPKHDRWNVVHGMFENVRVICTQCGKPMHRIPQAFRFYFNPGQLLLEKLGDRFNEYRKEQNHGIKRKHARGEPV